MSEDRGEVSEVDSFQAVETGYDEGDPTPDADYANQTEDGSPKNYGDVAPDENLPLPDETLPLTHREALRQQM